MQLEHTDGAAQAVGHNLIAETKKDGAALVTWWNLHGFVRGLPAFCPMENGNHVGTMWEPFG